MQWEKQKNPKVEDTPVAPVYPVPQVGILGGALEKPTKFPYTAEDVNRLQDYAYYHLLFEGKHFNAFNIRVSSQDYNKAYSQIRYVAVNFAGLVTRLCADMLFGEAITVKLENNQDWLDAWWEENRMREQLMESAMSASIFGDTCWKLRVGGLSGDPTMRVLAEEFTPEIYFPSVDNFNVRQDPQIEKVAWRFTQGKDEYLREEIHSLGAITNKIYKLKGENVEEELSPSLLGLPNQEATLVDTKNLVFHSPNWKSGKRFFGISDYADIDTLMFALNNRISKIDNILDKHGDPLLIVPPGVIDEKGRVRKDARVIEVQNSEDGKPEYIVWDAKLENAFSEIDRILDFLYMTAEVSPDVLGLGEGKVESGRALKFRLIRTLAKINRKKLYFDRMIKDLVYTAQMLAQAHGLSAQDQPFTGQPEMPEIDWQDGLPTDEKEQLENETMAIDAGVTTKKAAIMRIYNVDEVTAEEIMDEAEAEQPKLELPTKSANPMIGNRNSNKSAYGGN